MAYNEVNNAQDVLDSRDVIARMEELESEIEDAENGEDLADEREEFQALKSLAEEASQYSPDWPHGEGLIRNTYFTEYAEQLADDIGAVDGNANWPLCHIDWEAAANSLKQDYASVDFDGVEYWIRC